MAQAIAFDIGGTHVRAGVVTLDGTVTAGAKAALTDRSVEGVVRTCQTLASEVRTSSAEHFACCGVGLAAMIAAQTQRVENSPNLGWRDADFLGPLRAALDIEDAVLLNDLDAICLGEAATGAAAGARHVACVFVGTGVGSGLLLDGIPYAGFRGVGAELGHVKVGNAGRPCGCGAQDCLEAYAGGKNLTARVRQELTTSPALAPLDATAVELDAVDAIADENPWADHLWNEVSTSLGRAVANLVTVTNPEVLVFGGGVWDKCPALRDRTLRVFHSAVNAVAAEELRVCNATLGDRAGLVGAGVFALQSLSTAA